VNENTDRERGGRWARRERRRHAERQRLKKHGAPLLARRGAVDDESTVDS